MPFSPWMCHSPPGLLFLGSLLSLSPQMWHVLRFFPDLHSLYHPTMHPISNNDLKGAPRSPLSLPLSSPKFPVPRASKLPSLQAWRLL